MLNKQTMLLYTILQPLSIDKTIEHGKDTIPKTTKLQTVIHYRLLKSFLSS